jgi:hypothetical protein
LREECGLRVWRRIFGPKRDEVTKEWRKLHNELNNLYSSPSIVWVIKLRRVRWVGHVVHMGERRGIYRVLVGKRPLGRPILRWEGNIKMNLQKVGCGDIYWINMALNRDRWWALVNVVMNLQVP